MKDFSIGASGAADDVSGKISTDATDPIGTSAASALGSFVRALSGSPLGAGKVFHAAVRGSIDEKTGDSLLMISANFTEPARRVIVSEGLTIENPTEEQIAQADAAEAEKNGAAAPVAQ